MDLRRAVFAALALAFAGWAAVEARHLPVRDTHGIRRCGPSRAEVEARFAPIRRQIESGRVEEALLSLRPMAEKGAYRGYARFWLGEIAFRQGAYAQAVRAYRRAVEQAPDLGDRDGPFGARRALEVRLAFLRKGPWARNPPREVRDLYYLQRRLAGGCE